MFYRGGWCPCCNLQLSGLQTIEQDLNDRGFAIFAVSLDLPENLQKSAEKESLSYACFPTAIWRRQKLLGWRFGWMMPPSINTSPNKIDLEAASGRSHQLLPVPSVFTIDREGLVRFAHSKADYKTRLSPEEVKVAAMAVVEKKRAIVQGSIFCLCC